MHAPHSANATLDAPMRRDEKSPDVTVTLCVLLWARASHESGLIAYEDRVLELLPDHGGQVLERARTSGAADEPLEVQLLRFPSEDALAGFMHDERRVALSHERETAIARTQVLRVELI
jgi:uncharacterized protein (DUF1330 family)